MPFPIMAAADLGSGLISALIGAHQRSVANRMIANNPFPNMTIPQGVLDATKNAEIDANTGLPSAQYNQAQQNIDRNTNAAIRSSQDRRGGVSQIGAIQQGANDAALNLDVANANARIANKVRLMNQQNQLGQWQNQVWDWNKRQKYLQNAAAARALLGSSAQNFNTALDRGLSGALMLAGGKNNNSFGSDYSSYGGNPMYSNGYDENSNYSEFQTDN